MGIPRPPLVEPNLPACQAVRAPVYPSRRPLRGGEVKVIVGHIVIEGQGCVGRQGIQGKAYNDGVRPDTLTERIPDRKDVGGHVEIVVAEGEVGVVKPATRRKTHHLRSKI